MKGVFMRTVRKKRTWAEDLEIIRYLDEHDVKDTAQHFKTTESAVRSWLHRIRKRIRLLQDWLNRVRVLQKNSPRIRKLTTDGSLSAADREMEEEEKWQ
jgi:hypothetical protein